MKTTNNKYILNISEVAILFKVEEATVREWAKKKQLPARKIGKQWFFNRQAILGLQGESDAKKILGEGSQISTDKHYDILFKDKKIEVKSTSLLHSKSKGGYWQFSNFRNGSDYYLLLCYSENRNSLVAVLHIPTEDLKNYIKETSGSTSREPCFRVARHSDFYNKYLFNKEQ